MEGVRMLRIAVGMLIGLMIGAVATWAVVKNDKTLDPVKLAPDAYKVAFENERFRVIDYRMQAGGKEPMHSHPHGALIYLLSDAHMRTTLPSGAVNESSGKAGDVLWRDPVTHRADNIGTNEVHELIVEPKSDCK
jgi:beta-alanine degradation protein BauB